MLAIAKLVCQKTNFHNFNYFLAYQRNGSPEINGFTSKEIYMEFIFKKCAKLTTFQQNKLFLKRITS